ncbi:Fatty acid binding protein a [Fasciola gigantica]|uniref:Fatty acid binding protein a n=1 Tax=Fasciola gigantica TaxID=46835 RepID=A0A504Z0R2_FASGI|nr:Fatty acid binding protein a [Fasciola gigantica]
MLGGLTVSPDRHDLESKLTDSLVLQVQPIDLSSSEEVNHFLTMADFVGSWKLEHSENMDGVLKTLGVPSDMVDKVQGEKPEFTFELEGNKMTIKVVSSLKTKITTFTFGEEFKEETLDNRTVMTTVTKDSENKITQVQRCPEHTTHIVREVTGDKMVITITVGDVKAVNTLRKM